MEVFLHHQVLYRYSYLDSSLMFRKVSSCLFSNELGKYLSVLLQLACEDTRSFHISSDLISTYLSYISWILSRFFCRSSVGTKNNKTHNNLRFNADNSIRLSFTTLNSSNSQTIQWLTTVVRVRGYHLSMNILHLSKSL